MNSQVKHPLTPSSKFVIYFMLCNFLVALLWVAAPAFAEDKRLFLAEYQGKYSGMVIKSTRELLQQSDGSLKLKSQIKNSFASISETSDFTLKNGILVPQNYHYKRKIFAFKADENLKFDWQENIAEYRRKKKPEKNKDHPISAGTLDPALYQLQLQREVFRGRKQFEVTFAKSTKVKTLYFVTIAEEPLKIGDKTYNSVKLERDNRDDDKETRIWFIPEFNYQVAKVEHVEENGDEHTILLTRYESAPELQSILYESQPK